MPNPIATLLMTRPERSARQFVQALGPLPDGFEVIYSPLIDIKTTGPLPDLDGIGGVVFSSKNGVAAWRDLGGPVVDICYTVGDATAEAARQIGFTPISASGAADDLVAHIIDDAPTVRLLHIHGTHTRGEITERLTAAGIPTESATIYDQPLLPLSDQAKTALAGNRPVILPLFSPRTAAQFVAEANAKAPILVGALSNSVAKPLETKNYMSLVIADQPNSPSMICSVARLIDQAQKLEGRSTGH